MSMNINNIKPTIEVIPTCLTTDGKLGLACIVDNYLLNTFHDLTKINIEKCLKNIKSYTNTNLNKDYDFKYKVEPVLDKSNMIQMDIYKYFKPEDESIFSLQDYTPVLKFNETIDKIRALGEIEFEDKIYYFNNMCASTKRLSLIIPVENITYSKLEKQYIIEVPLNGEIRLGNNLEQVMSKIGQTVIYKELDTNLQDLINFKFDHYCLFTLANITNNFLLLHVSELYRKALGAGINLHLEDLPYNEIVDLLYTSNILTKEEYATPKIIIDRYDSNFVDLMKSYSILKDKEKIEDLVDKIRFGHIKPSLYEQIPPLKSFKENLSKLDRGEYLPVLNLLGSTFLKCQDLKINIWKDMLLYYNQKEYFMALTPMNDRGAKYYNSILKGNSGEVVIVNNFYKPRQALR